MAKQPIDVGVKFTGDASGIQKAAAQVKGSVQGMKKDIKETTGIFDELGGAIGGMAGDMASAVSGLATAATGIGAIVVVVGALAKAWQMSQENIDLYLKSADKLKAGSGGFTVDAEEARVDTRKRANGLISLGYKMEMENMAKLTKMRFLYNDEEKKHFLQLVQEGRQMQVNGRSLRDSVTGIHDKTAFQIKYTQLLKEEEQLNDASLLNKERWAELEAELVRQRTIIQDKDSKSKDKAQAVINAEIIANALLKEKNVFIDKQLANIKAIAEMTATQEVVEKKVADLQTQKNTNLKEYGTDMLKVLKMETKVTKEIEKQVSIQRQTGPDRANLSSTPRFGKSAEKGLRPDMIPEMAGNLQLAQIAVQELENSFTTLFLNVGGGFKGMVDAMLDSLKLLFAQLIGKAALFGLLQVLFPGSGMAVGALTGLRKFIGIPGYANGTNFAPGGLSLVGERGPELVNLPRGAKVIPNAVVGGDVLIAKLRGSEIDLILKRHYKGLNAVT